MRRLFSFLAVLVLLLAAGGAAASEDPPVLIDLAHNRNAMNGFSFPSDAEFLHVWIPMIANADEAVIIYRDEVFLIDCADKKLASRGADLLRDLGVTKIDKLFNSHPHHDHLGGLQITDEAAPVQEMYICFPADSTETMVEAMAYAAEQDIPVFHYENGDVFTMGDGEVTLKFYWPVVESDNPKELLDMNNSSAQTLLQYGSRRMLFTADLEIPGQKVLMEQFPAEDLRAEIIKYPHHGKSGLYEDYFRAVKPSLAVITNIYVKWSGKEYLTARGVPWLFTCSTDTYLHLYTDGATWVVERVPFGPINP